MKSMLMICLCLTLLACFCEASSDYVKNDAIEQRLATMETLIAELQQRDITQRQQLEEQSKMLATQQDRITSLEAEVVKLRADVRTDILQLVPALQKANTNMGDTVDTSAKDNHQATTNTGGVHSIRQIPEVVAFTAQKAKTQSSIGINQNIVFETVHLNEGGGYHNQHGIFITPASGIYLISSTLLSTHSSTQVELHAAIVVNGLTLARIYAHGDSGRHDQGGNSVITKLQAGDEVWVRNIDINNDAVYGDAYSTFSGYLLLPL